MRRLPATAKTNSPAVGADIVECILLNRVAREIAASRPIRTTAKVTQGSAAVVFPFHHVPTQVIDP